VGTSFQLVQSVCASTPRNLEGRDYTYWKVAATIHESKRASKGSAANLIHGSLRRLKIGVLNTMSWRFGVDAITDSLHQFVLNLQTGHLSQLAKLRRDVPFFLTKQTISDLSIGRYAQPITIPAERPCDCVDKANCTAIGKYVIGRRLSAVWARANSQRPKVRTQKLPKFFAGDHALLAPLTPSIQRHEFDEPNDHSMLLCE
jgi:hypothetical protein